MTVTTTNGAKPLASLLADLGEHDVRGEPSTPVTAVTYRSAEVAPGSLFFCVPGTRLDGHDFASEASAAGASALVVERWLPLPVAQVKVPSVRAAMGPVSARFYGRPAEEMIVVGVTGTNGKTTTTYLLESVFRAAGLTPGVIGTTGVRVDGAPQPFERTTPEAPDLHRLLADMRDRGVRAVAMEVSSHGLHQHRVRGIRYDCAVFTNLSQDHLDYHETMEEYFRAKASLFTPEMAELAVVNWDTPEGRELAGSGVPTMTYGLEEGAGVRAVDVETTAAGLSFRVEGAVVRCRLRGRFNVYNCLAALVAARSVGVDDNAILVGIGSLMGVPGRLEAIEAGQPFLVVVDYAHTPDSLENVLRTLRPLAGGVRGSSSPAVGAELGRDGERTPRSEQGVRSEGGRVIVAFGCGGDRDRVKRPLMGRVATRLADLTVVTSDNPRSEDPLAIIGEIEGGARAGGGRYVVEPDRRTAIRLALREAGPGDVVVIAGKGHETGQEFADRTIPFDDRVVAAEEMRALLEEAGESP